MEPQDQNCIFCQIAAGHSPAQMEYQDADVVAFWDIQPSAPTHLLIVPKKHIARLSESVEEDQTLLGKMLYAAKEVARRKGLDADGYRVVLNNGGHAGQVVEHLHMHLLGGADLGPMTNAKANPTSQYS